VLALHKNRGYTETSGLAWSEFGCRAGARAGKYDLVAWRHKEHLDTNGEGFLFFRDREHPPKPYAKVETLL
jgi:hypothetical protein